MAAAPEGVAAAFAAGAPADGGAATGPGFGGAALDGDLGAAAVAGFAAASPAVSSVRIMLPSLNRSPSLTLRSLTTPAAGEGTSMVALSDSSVTSESSGATVSPGFTSTSMTGTSLKSPMSGTLTSISWLTMTFQSVSALEAARSLDVPRELPAEHAVLHCLHHRHIASEAAMRILRIARAGPRRVARRANHKSDLLRSPRSAIR